MFRLYITCLIRLLHIYTMSHYLLTVLWMIASVLDHGCWVLSARRGHLVLYPGHNVLILTMVSYGY
jgi:hypothetical protein